ncbi:helicase associated domain-containing protein [uncultured Oscillibacter sp.]|nr:helicase associated domain-containing protein [uncultured Oscillibacter sp.]
MATQRRVRMGQQYGNLTPERIEKLDSIGMIWGNRRESAWNRG